MTSRKNQHEDKMAQLESKLEFLGNNDTVEQLYHSTKAVHAQLKEMAREKTRVEEQNQLKCDEIELLKAEFEKKLKFLS